MRGLIIESLEVIMVLLEKWSQTDR
jgi:hypothetical protein